MFLGKEKLYSYVNENKNIQNNYSKIYNQNSKYINRDFT